MSNLASSLVTMTEQQLISKLQELKQIKPRENWVVLSKANIFEPQIVVKRNIFNLFTQRKLAYAFATLLFVFAGVAGVLKYQVFNNPQIAGNSQTAAIAENTLKINVEEFKAKSQVLADAVKYKYQNPDVAVKEVKNAATKLSGELQKNPELAKVIALDVNNNKSLLDIPGGNDVSEVANIYKAIDEQLIRDLEKVTLTQDQKIEFTRIKKAFDDGEDYTTVLRDILLMNASRDTNI